MENQVSRQRAHEYLCKQFGIDFPYYTMGKIDAYHLFGLETEMPILAMYEANSTRWSKVLDIGANLGLHSILMDRLGWTVQAFEPDYQTFERLELNLKANHCKNVTARQAAVSTETGEAEFVRVLDNLTGNHLKGFKDSYGPRETVLVATADCRPLFDWADFAKLDCEGNEAALMLTTTPEQMAHLSMIAEVRNEQNALSIYRHFRELGVPMWSQRTDWKAVQSFGDMPTCNRHGSLFIGHEGPWI